MPDLHLRSSDVADEPPVLGLLDARDFRVALRTAPGFSAWPDYEHFTAERDALYIGYGVSGVTAELQPIRFSSLLRWSRLTGAPLDVESLDTFASHWRWRARHPDAPTIGWLGPALPSAHHSGAQCVCVRPDVFARWVTDFTRSGLFEAPSLDAYATRTVELCLPAARLPAVRSS